MDNTGPKPRSHLFGFLDETGLLHTPDTDRFFGLGIVVVQNTKHLHRSILKLKQRRTYYKEFKFNDINTRNLPIYKELVDIAINEISLRFGALIVDKKGKKQHASVYKAYNNYTGDLVSSLIDLNSKCSEYITVLADDVSTNDKDDRFEQDVRQRIKSKTRRNALFGIARLESHAVSEIQLCDVLVGVIAYAFKMERNIVSTRSAKAQLVKYVQTKINTFKLAENLDLRLKNGVILKVTVK